MMKRGKIDLGVESPLANPETIKTYNSVGEHLHERNDSVGDVDSISTSISKSVQYENANNFNSSVNSTSNLTEVEVVSSNSNYTNCKPQVNQVNPLKSSTKKEVMGKDKEMENDDEAKEKMLDVQEANIVPSKNAAEVLFISENGDAKIEIENGKPILCGMDREELMKYANDPFWVKLRWSLFIGFWIIWFAMLAGAIFIIFMAPKCAAVEPRKLWQHSPIVKIKTSDLIDLKTNNKVEETLKKLHENHVEFISLEPIFEGSLSNPDGGVVNFTSVDPKIGDLEFIKSIIKAANKQNQKILMEIDPNHSSINSSWFNSSVYREEPYTNYYVWADGKKDPAEPNNWKIVGGNTSAWKFNEIRNQYYLHQFSENLADFNFNNTLVINEFNKIFEFWLKLGIGGFRIGKSQYLIEDSSNKDEVLTAAGGASNLYDDYIHVQTKDNEMNVVILKTWRNTTLNHSKDAVFSLRDDTSNTNFARIITGHTKVIDLPQRPEGLIKAANNITSLNRTITQWIVDSTNTTWPGWDLNSGDSSSNHTDQIVLMALLLPGTPILELNHIINNEKFATVAKLRSSESFLHGNFSTFIKNETVFGYMSIHKGHPGQLVLYQTTDEEITVDLSEIEHIPHELTVEYAADKNYSASVSSNKVTIKGKSTLIMTFAPENMD